MMKHGREMDLFIGHELTILVKAGDNSGIVLCMRHYLQHNGGCEESRYTTE